MAGQYWTPAAEGGYLYQDELSDVLRTTLQPMCKFRQFSEPREADKPLHKGEAFYWNVAGDITPDGTTEIGERQIMPEGDAVITQSSLTVKEMGWSVPHSFKLEALAKQDIVAMIERQLSDHARKWFDATVYTQFDATPLRVVPTSGTSTTALTLDTDGVTAVTNNIELGKEHVNLVQVTMNERNIPGYMGEEDYICLSRPQTLEPVRQDLELIHQYTETGLRQVFEGEIGRYNSTRFVKQTWIPAGGAVDAASYNVFTGTTEAWDNGKSSWAFFFGDDLVLECLIIPEEVRAKIPTNYGLSKGLAWYFMGGFGIVHTDATNARIVKWDSAT